MHFILLTMLLFIRLFWYEERVASLFTKYYCKSSIYAFVSNLTILIFLKVIDLHLVEDLWIEIVWGGGGLFQVGDKAQKLGGMVLKCEDTMKLVIKENSTCGCHTWKQHLIAMACNSKLYVIILWRVISVKLIIGKKITGLGIVTLNHNKNVSKLIKLMCKGELHCMQGCFKKQAGRADVLKCEL